MDGPCQCRWDYFSLISMRLAERQILLFTPRTFFSFKMTLICFGLKQNWLYSCDSEAAAASACISRPLITFVWCRPILRPCLQFPSIAFFLGEDKDVLLVTYCKKYQDLWSSHWRNRLKCLPALLLQPAPPWEMSWTSVRKDSIHQEVLFGVWEPQQILSHLFSNEAVAHATRSRLKTRLSLAIHLCQPSLIHTHTHIQTYRWNVHTYVLKNLSFFTWHVQCFWFWWMPLPCAFLLVLKIKAAPTNDVAIFCKSLQLDAEIEQVLHMRSELRRRDWLNESPLASKHDLHPREAGVLKNFAFASNEGCGGINQVSITCSVRPKKMGPLRGGEGEHECAKNGRRRQYALYDHRFTT